MRQSLLLCILLFSFQLAAVAQSPPPWKPFSSLSPSAFINELKEISGKDGVDCGTTSRTKPEDSVAACGEATFQDGKPFFLAYLNRTESYLTYGYGLVTDQSGSLFVVNSFPHFQVS